MGGYGMYINPRIRPHPIAHHLTPDSPRLSPSFPGLSLLLQELIDLVHLPIEFRFLAIAASTTRTARRALPRLASVVRLHAVLISGSGKKSQMNLAVNH